MANEPEVAPLEKAGKPLRPLPKKPRPVRRKLERQETGVSPAPSLHTLEAEGPTTAWQTTLWREWCHAQDDDYAFYLFRLVNQTALGWKMIATVTLLYTLIGLVIGYLVGDLFGTLRLTLGYWGFTLTPALPLAWMMGVIGAFWGIWSSREFRSWYFWWQGQPPALKVERALHHACRARPDMKDVWLKPLQQAEAERAEARSPEALVELLQSRDWTERFAARQALVARGGKATEALLKPAGDSEHPLWRMAIWVLGSIEQDTANRFAWRPNQVYCPTCLALFAPRPVNVSLGISFTYHGCRLCGQSQKSLYVPEGSVAVLDAAATEPQTLEEGVLRVQWLLRRNLFDFDRVEIRRATDEDVERFAVQVGNDTDPFRRARYKQIACQIDGRCRLSENTLRILRHTFGQVESQKYRPERLKQRTLTDDQLSEQQHHSRL